MICEDDSLTNTAIDNDNLRRARDILVQLISEEVRPTRLCLEYALACGWPTRTQQIHPTIEDPYYYWGEDPFTPTRFPLVAWTRRATSWWR